MKFEERARWLKEYILKAPGQHVGILNSAFVDAYIAATGAGFRPTMFGAHKCPQLSRDLGRMWQSLTLRRSVSGLHGLPSGFPKWVYTYHL